MLFSEINDRHVIDYDDNYAVVVDKAPFIVLSVGFDAHNSKGQFSHPNLLARQYEIHEYKHYHPVRGKFWTAKAGVNLYFAVPKDKIELVEEKGYSYPKVIIGGKEITLSTSGGGGKDGWNDFIGCMASTLTNMPKNKLQAIADNAMSIGDAKRLGVCLEFDKTRSYENEEQAAERRESDRKALEGMVAKRTVAPQLKEGMKAVLSHGYRFGSYRGGTVFDIIQKQKRQKHVHVECGNAFARLYYKHIDWLETAKVNKIELPAMVNENRVPKVNE